jgi:L-2,4-diaminobutyrate transaminase
MNDSTLAERDRQTLLHPFTNLKAFAAGGTGGPRIVSSGDGIRIRDSDGNVFIDAFAGLYCVNVGYGRQEIADALYAQAKDTTTAMQATRRKSRFDSPSVF